MRIVKKIVIALIILGAVLAAIGFVMPRNYKVERSVSISAPAEVIFDLVNNLRKNETWSPWERNDPTLKITYSGPEAGKGASSAWTSEKSGNGSQTIEESVPNQSITTYLDFGAHGNAKGHWTFTPEGDAIRVTQGMSGDGGMNPFKRLMGGLMDKMVGKYFEQGLAALKEVSEKRAAEAKAETAAPQASAAPTSAPGEASAPAAAPATMTP